MKENLLKRSLSLLLVALLLFQGIPLVSYAQEIEEPTREEIITETEEEGTSDSAQQGDPDLTGDEEVQNKPASQEPKPQEESIELPVTQEEGELNEVGAQLLSDEPIILKNGTAAIPKGASEDDVKKALFDALVENPEGFNYEKYEWEYYCKGTSAINTINDAWGSVFGFESNN